MNINKFKKCSRNSKNTKTKKIQNHILNIKKYFNLTKQKIMKAIVIIKNLIKALIMNNY